MKQEKRIEKFLRRIDVIPDAERKRLRLEELLEARDKTQKSTSADSQPIMGRFTMNRQIWKVAAVLVFAATVVGVIGILQNGGQATYALEQTTKAYHSIRTIHLRMFRGQAGSTSHEFMDCWAKYDDAGWVTNFRRNFYGDVHKDDSNLRFTVWNEGILKTWIPLKNVVTNIKVNNEEKYWEHFARNYDPKLLFERLYDLQKNKAVKLEINEPVKGEGPIYVKAVNSDEKTRLELVVDRQTKLVKQFSRYHLGEQNDKLDFRIEYLAYNQPIDQSVFILGGIPDDAKVVDRIDRVVRVDQVVGLEEDNLTHNEIAARVVHESLNAAVEKDYEEVSRLVVDQIGDTIGGFVEEEFGAKLVRVISIGQPKPHTVWPNILCVPSEIEIEDEGGAKWAVNITTTAKTIGYQPGNQWIAHTNLEAGAKERIVEGIIVPGVGVGDYTLGMSKDEVLRRLGEPKFIYLGGKTYTLDDLPRRYRLFYGHIEFEVHDNTVQRIKARNPLYKFANGLGVGNSEDKIKKTFGKDFELSRSKGEHYLNYEAEGVNFAIHTKDRNVEEITVFRPADDHRENDAPRRQEQSTRTIVPGESVGEITLGMSKNEVLRKLGDPKTIYLGNERYTLDNLPIRYIMYFGHMKCEISYNEVQEINVLSPSYTFDNGLGVGDSEGKIKQTFGQDFYLDDGDLIYAEKGLEFDIDEDSKTVEKITIIKARPKRAIVPGVGIGDVTLGMSKDVVLKKLGKPRSIFFGHQRYTLDNLPTRYRLHYGYIEFEINDNAVRLIKTRSPHYRFSNGMGVGDSIEKIKRTFGSDFDVRRNCIYYDGKGVFFEINEEDNRIIGEISVRRRSDDHSDNTSRSHNPLPGPLIFPKIDRRPEAASWQKGELKALPKYDPDSGNPWQMDLRTRDVSKFDLSNSIDDLLYTTFDDRTVWPANDKIPSGFDPQRIMELGKNPGLGVRSLHKKGITGRGVRIAIIDQPLLVDHQEYAGRLQLYEEIHIKHGTGSQMHGPAVASIAVGNTVGVAPEAELFYIAQFNFNWEKKEGDRGTLRYLAQGIHRIVEINEKLPQDKKIRVISISKGWTRSHKEYDLITAAAQKARSAGMLIVSCAVELIHDGCGYAALGRSPLADPDVFESYEPVLYAARSFWARDSSPDGDEPFIPVDSRATASPHGIDEYVFYRMGGSSWAPPYIAGVYAMAVQVNPDITPEGFWALAVKTGRTVEVERNGKKRRLGPIIDPVRLIRSIEAGEVVNMKRSRSSVQPLPKPSQKDFENKTIVPGAGIGEITLGMSKDDVLKKLGKPRSIFFGNNRFTLDNLPVRYRLHYGYIEIEIDDNAVRLIKTRNPYYRFSNDVGVGDSIEKIKRTFGSDFEVRGNCIYYVAKAFSLKSTKRTETLLERSAFVGGQMTIVTIPHDPIIHYPAP
jgi:outer membrane protein assembly factor BamE (lipoprotein component of BamABCDE complex)